MAKRARHRYSFGNSHCEVTSLLTRKFQPACRYFRGRCVDERGALWERVSGPFQSRSAGANSRKATKQLTLWQAFVLAHARGLAKVPATANLVLAYGKRWRRWPRRVAVHLRVSSAHRITNWSPADKKFCRGLNQGLSEPLQKFQLRRSCFRVFFTREPAPDLGQSSTGNLRSRGGANLGGANQAVSAVGMVHRVSRPFTWELRPAWVVL